MSNIVPAYSPRDYQRAMLKARANGVKRGISIWHRRAGKDLTVLNMLWTEALKRVGLYNYYFPTFALAKSIVWKGMTKEGKPFLSYIPSEIIKAKHETDLRLELVNGSIIKLVGTENVDQNIVGINPVGAVFSEYSLQDPMAWELTRPILAENGGWAWFVYTPRGRNHGYRQFKIATDNPDSWFAQILTIRETSDSKGRPIVSEEYVKQEIAEGMDPDLAQQEFYCSFDAPMQGSYFGRLLATAFNKGRIEPVSYRPGFPVFASWDLGVSDQTAIWFAQVIGDDVNLIDYYENTGEGFDHYYKYVMEKPYTYDTMYFPHDLRERQWGTGRSFEEVVVKTFAQRNVHVKVLDKLSLESGIDAVRRLFPRFRIDQQNCERTKYRGHSAIDCLASYHKKWSADKQEYMETPQHDWASHCADALRYLALGLRDRPVEKIQHQLQTYFNPMVDAVTDGYDHEFHPFSYDSREGWATH